jgi:redox-sensitive bicupin YhaK (pirin superfamily)
VAGMTDREVAELLPAQRAVEGEGFVVRRPFPTMQRSYVDPFLLWDHMGPVDHGPGEGVGTSPHPHRGFETVTYLLKGELEHRDSLGNHGFLGEGDTQWMTAGRGVIHKEGPSEAFKARGGTLHGLQLWVNLPADEKMRPASYQDIRATEVAVVEPSEGVTARVVAGEAFGVQGPGHTVTPINYVHLTMVAGSVARTAVPADHNVMAYPLVGSFSVPSAHGDDVAVPEGVMAIFAPGDQVELHGPADGGPAEVILLTGQPLNEPVVREGPFVMNTRAELLQAFEDYNAGRFVEA